MELKHTWQARVGVALAMLVLAFLGMVITDIRTSGGWNYWKWTVPIYAILALWLSWYTRKSKKMISPITLWHELLHWIGLILAVLLVSVFVRLGTISSFNAGLFNLTLLALAIYLAGIYIDPTMIFIGLILGIFALLTAFTVQYLYAFLIPISIAAALLIAIVIWINQKRR